MRARPNPFALPSPTDLRFVLLVASILGASLYVYTLLYLSFPGNGAAYARALDTCEAVAESAYPSDALAQHVAVQSCLAPFYRVQSIWVAAGILVLLAVAYGIVRAYPGWKIRRDGLQPLLMDDSPELGEYLAELRRDAGLRVAPTFLVSPAPTASGVAFGRPGRYYVALGSGLVTLYLADRPAFRAIVLHELSHVRNADVSKAYLSLAVGAAFGIAALAPLALVFVATRLAALIAKGALPAGADFAGLAIPSLALCVSAYLTWAAILRSREYFADLRVVQVDAESLPMVLGRLSSQRVSLARRLTLTHPEPSARREALVDPRPVLTIGFWDAFASGLAGAIAFVGLQAYLGLSLSGTPASAWSSALASVVFVPLAGGVVGLGIWRAALAERINADRISLWRLALGLWLGLIVGRTLSYEGGVLPPAVGAAPVLGTSLLLAAVLLLVCLFFVYWVRDGAVAWIEAAFAEGGLGLTCAVGLAIVGAILSLCLAVIFLFADTLGSADLSAAVTLGGLGLVFQLPTEPLAPAAVLALWAYPLAAYLWRRAGPTAVPDWARFDPSDEPPPVVAATSLRLRRSIAVGAVGGLISGGLLALLLVALSRGGPPSEEEATTLLVLELGWVALAQAAIAAVAAGRAAHLRLEQGLLAAFVAACVQTLCWAAQALALGTLDPDGVWYFLSYAVVVGGMVGLVTAGIAAWVASLVGDGERDSSAEAVSYQP